MEVVRDLYGKEKAIGKNDGKNDMLRNFAVMTGCAVLTVSMAIGSRFAAERESGKVYAASGTMLETVEEAEQNLVPTGIASVVSGVSESNAAGTRVERIGTSCENVMVGQRVQVIGEKAYCLNAGSSMENTVNTLDQTASRMAETSSIMSDEDYDTLLRIVEAEAGSEDVKGRILVANVIMNRIKSDEFPDTVTEVVWDNQNGVPQFSPTDDGRIYEVTVSDETREAVRQVLEGVDYSQGALFFVEKDVADPENVSWFEKNLKKLFKYGVHDFYTYPD